MTPRSRRPNALVFLLLMLMCFGAGVAVSGAAGAPAADEVHELTAAVGDAEAAMTRAVRPVRTAIDVRPLLLAGLLLVLAAPGLKPARTRFPALAAARIRPGAPRRDLPSRAPPLSSR